MKFKKLTATLLTATLVVANVMPVMAAEPNDVTGTGAVEYDNSEAVQYDSVTVPVVLDADNYEFELDPTHQLTKFNSVKYSAADTVFFNSTAPADRAKVQKTKDSTVTKLYKKDKVEYEQKDQDADHPWVETGVWEDVVKTVAAKAISEVNTGYFVWTPDTTNASAVGNLKYSKGLPGTLVELDATNIGNWFELEDPEDASNKNIKLKVGYKIKGGADESGSFEACDGKIYKEDYVELASTTVIDTDTDPLSDYATKSGDTVTFVNLYTENGGNYALATSTDFEYVDAEPKLQGRTNAVTVTNKSTKSKTITATVKVKNAESLSFNNSATFTAGDDTTKLYVAATNGTDTFAVSKAEEGASEATATYTVDLDPASTADVTYMTTGNNNAGGHNYARFEGFGVDYDSDSFYIVAAANDDAAAAEAWVDWAKSIDGTTVKRPEINIVYTVANTKTAEEIAAEEAAAAAAAAAEAAATAAAGFKTTYAAVVGLTTETVTGTEDEQTAISAAATAFDALDDAVKTILAEDGITASFFTDLLAASEAAAADDIPTMTLQSNGNLTYTFEESGRPTGTLTAIVINGTGRKGQVDNGNITYNSTNGFLKITAAAITAIGGIEEGNTSIVATIGGVEYTLAY